MIIVSRQQEGPILMCCNIIFLIKLFDITSEEKYLKFYFLYRGTLGITRLWPSTNQKLPRHNRRFITNQFGN